MDEVKILAVNGQLGYGFPIDSFREGMRRNPDIVGVDGGSSDAGPYYLGSGEAHTGREGVKRDLAVILPEVLTTNTPLIIGSASTAGGEPHIAKTLEVLQELAAEKNLQFRIAIIHSEVDKTFVKKKLQANKITPLGSHVDMLTEKMVENSTRIVGQMGVTPFIRALDSDADIVLAGRSCDTAIFAALPIKKGFDPGLSFHAAKVMECGAYGTVPGSSSDCLWGEIRRKDFILDSLNPIRRCTPVSVAAHTMYEQGHPSIFHEPDGTVDCTNASFEQYSETAVRVWGTEYRPVSDRWTIKLEGAALEGYRTIAVAGVRDPMFIKHIDKIISHVKEEVAENLGESSLQGYDLTFRVYGKDAILGELETAPCNAHELGIIIDVVGKSQAQANSICALARASMLHAPFPDRKTTGGNIAIPYSPSDLPVGPVYQFSVYHLVEVDDPDELFSIEIVEVGIS